MAQRLQFPSGGRACPKRQVGENPHFACLGLFCRFWKTLGFRPSLNRIGKSAIGICGLARRLGVPSIKNTSKADGVAFGILILAARY